MLHLLPRQTPSLEQMLEDLGNPHPRKLAKALGVCERTAWRWRKEGVAPRTAMLALYWITQWGQNQVHTEAHNEAKLFRGYVNCLKEENVKLRAQLAQLGRIGDFGAANDPTPGAATRGVAPPAPQPLSFSAFERAFERTFSADQPRSKPGSTTRQTASSTNQLPSLPAWLRAQQRRKAA